MDLAGRLSNPRRPLIPVYSQVEGILARADTRRPPARNIQVQRRLPSAEIGTLVAARYDGVTIDALARQFGIHRTTVLAHLNRENRRGSEPRARGNPPTG